MDIRNVLDIEEEEKIGQESEEDIINLKEEDISNAVLWATDWTTETVISQLKKGNIELSPSFQRRDAWGSDRKSRFIESIILGLPIPQIILAERKERKGSYIVIDGKQRLLSLRQFCVIKDENDEFLPLKLHSLKLLKELNDKSYETLVNDDDFQKYIASFDNQSIRTVIIRNWPNQSFLYTVFLRLNTGSLPLSPQELRQALIPGSFTSFVDEFSSNSLSIQQALGIKKPDYRMRDAEIVVRFFAFKNYMETYRGNLKDFLDKTCDLLNKEWIVNDQFIVNQANDLEAAINTTFDIFGENSFSKYSSGKYTRAFNRPVFDIMTYFFSIKEVREASILKAKEIISAFEKLCSQDVQFIRSLETSTKNVDPLSKRYNEWGGALRSILKLKFGVPTKTQQGIKVL